MSAPSAPAAPADAVVSRVFRGELGEYARARAADYESVERFRFDYWQDGLGD